jgi:hypothetical protein
VVFIAEAGVPPHAGRLTCSGCGRFAGWLSMAKTADLLRRAAS